MCRFESPISLAGTWVHALVFERPNWCRPASFALAMLGQAFAAAAQDASFTLDTSKGEDRPCVVRFDKGRPTLTMNLEYSRGDWRLMFWLGSAPAAMIGLFDERGLRDNRAVEAAVKSVLIDGADVEKATVELWEVMRKDLSDRSSVSVAFEPLRQVMQVVQRFPANEIRIGNLASISGLSEGLQAFKECALSAVNMPLEDAMEFDGVAEARLIFERAFPKWVEARAWLSACQMLPEDDAILSDAVDRAAAAFYPGLLSYSWRSEWSKDMIGSVPVAKLGGATSAVVDGCASQAVVLESGWSAVVEKAIQQAQD